MTEKQGETRVKKRERHYAALKIVRRGTMRKINSERE